MRAKKRPRECFRLSPKNADLLYKSGILNTLTKTKFFNLAISKYFEKINMDGQLYGILKEFQESLPAESERDMLLQMKREFNSRLYFYNRFSVEFRSCIKLAHTKNEIEQLLHIWIQLSKTYKNNYSLTNKLKNLYFQIVRMENKELDYYKELAKIEIANLKENEGLRNEHSETD